MIYGERVKQARALLGESQGVFGDHVGLAQSKVSEIENGTLQPNDAALLRIAEHSGFPPEYFERPPMAAVNAYQFRAQARLKATDRRRAIASSEVVHESHILMRRQTTAPSVQIPRMLGADARAAARKVRAILGVHPFAPVGNLTLPLERLGVVILALSVHGNKHDAFSWWHEDVNGVYPVLATLAGAPGDRLRWNIAHELGHLVLHGEGTSKDMEAEANVFAAELLTPLEALRLEMPARPTLSAFYAMKARWGVAVQSLIRRAKELGVVDDGQYMSLFRQISARGERMNERVPISPEKPRAYRKMAEVLFGPEPQSGLAALSAWTPSFAQDVLVRFAAAHELPGQLIVRQASLDGVADVVPMRASRSFSSGQRRPS